MKSKRRKAVGSVASFLFMPQFKYSFQGIAHLYPLFMQMLAITFVSAGLLPRNHPATRHGARDVQKYRISDVIGEAWYNLRRRRDTDVRSWAMFASIILMCGAFLGTMGVFFARVFLGLGSVAQAQLFTLSPNAFGPGPSAPAGYATDLDTAQANMTATPNVGALAPMFDKRMSKAQGLAYDDWGLIMLDKIVREAAMTPQMGGQLQNALTNILGLFNTAMSILAAIMIFWIIVSVVVDTAAKGVFGGRHNMVWLPMRIVFALGLLIPIGSQGFSSGQYCVMKLAEWGSNLGSNGWTQYVAGVSNSGGMLAPIAPGGSAGLVNDIAMMKVCEVAYDDYVWQGAALSGGTPDPGQLVGAMNVWTGDGTHLKHILSNNANNALCGALNISVPFGAAPGDAAFTTSGLTVTAGDAFSTGGWVENTTGCGLMGCVQPRPTTGSQLINYGMTIVEDGIAVLAASTFTGAWLSQGMDATCSSCINPLATFGAAPGTYASAMAQARQQTAYAWIKQLATVEATKGNGMIEDFACSFVAHAATGGDTSGTDNAQAAEIEINGTTYTNGPTTIPLCNAAAANLCGGAALPAAPATPPASGYPDYSCHSASISSIATPVAALFGGTDGVTGTISAILNAWLAGNIQNEMAKYGWASAGAYYSKVASMNVQAQTLSQPAITFTPGVLSTVQQTCDIELGTSVCNPSGIGYRTATVMQKYSTWYDTTTQTGKGAPGTNGVASLAGPNSGGSGVAFESDKTDTNTGLSAKAVLKGGKSALNSAIMSALGIPENRHPFMVNLVGGVADNTLPMANLSAIGAKMVTWGSMMLIAVSLIQGVIGGANFVVSTISLGLSCMFTMIFSMCQIVIVAGITLAFYVPLMPFVRSAFAVMTWMVSVFEAVVMVPVAALAHITTEGEGLKGSAGKCWVMWLNVLTRPILFVIGFVGAYIVYDAWVVYFTVAFSAASGNALDQDNIVMKLLGYCYDAVVYVSTCYAAANSVFKMVDMMPNALMKWMPGGGTVDMFNGSDAVSATQGYSQAFAKQVGDTASQGAGILQKGATAATRQIIADRAAAAAAGPKVGRGGGSGGAGGAGGAGGGTPPADGGPTGGDGGSLASSGAQIPQLDNPTNDAGVNSLNALARGLGKLPGMNVQGNANTANLSAQEKQFIQNRFSGVPIDNLPNNALVAASPYLINQGDPVAIMENYYAEQKAAGNSNPLAGGAPAGGGQATAGNVAQLANPNNDPTVNSLNSMARGLNNLINGPAPKGSGAAGAGVGQGAAGQTTASAAGQALNMASSSGAMSNIAGGILNAFSGMGVNSADLPVNSSAAADLAQRANVDALLGNMNVQQMMTSTGWANTETIDFLAQMGNALSPQVNYLTQAESDWIAANYANASPQSLPGWALAGASQIGVAMDSATEIMTGVLGQLKSTM